MQRRLKSPSYRADIDGLRAIAVLAVVFFHAFPNAVAGGFVGVDIFFVISGFLITSLLLANLDKGSFSFADFYARRIRRIFPALILVLTASLVFGYVVLLSGEFRQLGRHIAGSAGFVANLVFWNEAGYFDRAADTKPLLHIWSLGVEEQFYAVWPVLLLFLYRARLNIVLVLCLMAIASFAYNLDAAETDLVKDFYSPATRFWELLLGALLACALPTFQWPKRIRQWRLQPKSSRDMAAGAGFAFILTAIISVDQTMRFPGWLALLPTLGTCLIIAAGPKAWLNRNILEHRYLVGIGLISYPLYLWHWPLLSFYRILENQAPPPGTALFIIGSSILLAAITYVLVEKPIRFGKHANKKTIALCIMMLTVGIAGYLGAMMKEPVNPLENGLEETTRELFGNSNCAKSLGRTPVKGEICYTKTTHPTILLTGDSHALALDAAAFAGKSRVLDDAVVIAAHGCLPFTDFESGWPGENMVEKNCLNVVKDIIAAVSDIPSIERVILASRGSYYFKGTDFRIFHGAEFDVQSATTLFADGHPVSDPEQAFIDGYSDVIGKLIALGKQVIFVMEWPELGIDPYACAAERPGSQDCIYKRSLIDDRQKEYRKVVEKIKQRNPAMIVYDSTPIFCDAENCYGRNASGMYFMDNDHLTVAGSKLFLDAFGPWLAKQ